MFEDLHALFGLPPVTPDVNKKFHKGELLKGIISFFYKPMPTVSPDATGAMQAVAAEFTVGYKKRESSGNAASAAASKAQRVVQDTLSGAEVVILKRKAADNTLLHPNEAEVTVLNVPVHGSSAAGNSGIYMPPVTVGSAAAAAAVTAAVAAAARLPMAGVASSSAATAALPVPVPNNAAPAAMEEAPATTGSPSAPVASNVRHGSEEMQQLMEQQEMHASMDQHQHHMDASATDMAVAVQNKKLKTGKR